MNCDTARWLATQRAALKLRAELTSAIGVAAHYQQCGDALIESTFYPRLDRVRGAEIRIGDILVWCSTCGEQIVSAPLTISSECKACGQVHEVAT